MKFKRFSLLDRYEDVLCAQTPSFTREAPLNIAFHTGDDPAKVLKNRKSICDFLGVGLENLCVGEQTHGCFVRLVTRLDAGVGATTQKSAFADTDAMTTNEKGIFLMSMTADCVAVGFYDPINKAVAVAHSGWKGTAKNISVKTIEKMSASFGSKPEDLTVVMGAAVKGCCYEVGDEVVEQISQTIPQDSRPQAFKPLSNGKTSLDLHEAIKQQLINAGVKPSSIEIVQKCTCCDSDYFSYRQDSSCGRFGLIIGLRD